MIPGYDDRRDFLDSFAYLCDVEKGGRTVSATALQKQTTSDCLWLAANEGVREDVVSYARGMLSMLRTTTVESQVSVQDRVFATALEMCKARVQYYQVEVKRYATQCRMALKYNPQDDLGIWL